jgi:hypothetical protein
MTLYAPKRSAVVVNASTGFYLRAAAGTSPVDLLLRIDGRVVGQCFGFAVGANGNTIACNGFLAHAEPGRHDVAMLATALGNQPVGVGSLSLSAIAAPTS